MAYKSDHLSSCGWGPYRKLKQAVLAAGTGLILGAGLGPFFLKEKTLQENAYETRGRAVATLAAAAPLKVKSTLPVRVTPNPDPPTAAPSGSGDDDPPPTGSRADASTSTEAGVARVNSASSAPEVGSNIHSRPLPVSDPTLPRYDNSDKGPLDLHHDWDQYLYQSFEASYARLSQRILDRNALLDKIRQIDPHRPSDSDSFHSIVSSLSTQLSNNMIGATTLDADFENLADVLGRLNPDDRRIADIRQQILSHYYHGRKILEKFATETKNNLAPGILGLSESRGSLNFDFLTSQGHSREDAKQLIFYLKAKRAWDRWDNDFIELGHELFPSNFRDLLGALNE